MEIKHDENGHKGSFYVEDNGKRAGEMTYSLAGNDTLIIDHTEVNDSLRGQGAGLKMLLALVEYVRCHNIKVIPLCPFAKSVFDKREDLRDVLK